MSDSSVPSQSALSTFAQSSKQYNLSDDLARLCLPQEWSDSCRTLAWVNSVCFLFLIVGLIGLKAPRVNHKPLPELTETVPVVFTPPEEPPKTEPEVKPDEPEQPQNATEETPTVAPIVAVIDSPAVAFSVPVQGAVAVAQQARLATPPPPVERPPAKPVQFNPHTAGEGTFADPQYPAIALRNHYEGTAIIEIAVDTTGTAEAKLFKSSGFTVLDEAALDVVKRRWHFPSGQQRLYHWACTFRLQ